MDNPLCLTPSESTGAIMRQIERELVEIQQAFFVLPCCW